jgi:hypothetical protein
MAVAATDSAAEVGATAAAASTAVAEPVERSAAAVPMHTKL